MHACMQVFLYLCIFDRDNYGVNCTGLSSLFPPLIAVVKPKQTQEEEKKMTDTMEASTTEGFNYLLETVPTKYYKVLIKGTDLLHTVVSNQALRATQRTRRSLGSREQRDVNTARDHSRVLVKHRLK